MTDADLPIKMENLEALGMLAGNLQRRSSPTRPKPRPNSQPIFPTLRHTVRLHPLSGQKKSSEKKGRTQRKVGGIPITAVDRHRLKTKERAAVTSKGASLWMGKLQERLDKALSDPNSSDEQRLQLMRSAFDEVISNGPKEWRPLLAEIQYEYEAAVYRSRNAFANDEHMVTQNPQDAMRLGFMKSDIEDTKHDITALEEEIASIEEEIRATNSATLEIEKSVRSGQILDAVPRSDLEASKDDTGVQALHDQISETVLKINGIEKHHRDNCVPSSVVEWLQRSVVEAEDQKSQLQAQNELLQLDIGDLQKRHNENMDALAESPDNNDDINTLLADYELKKREVLEHADDLYQVEEGW